MFEHRQGCDSEGVAGFVESPADRHLDVRSDLLDRHPVPGHREQPGEEGVVAVGEVVVEHLVEGEVDLVEGPLGLRPDDGVVGVVADAVDERLGPALHVLLADVVEPDHPPQRLGGVRGGEVPDEVRSRTLLDELREEVLGDLAIHLRPDPLDVARLEDGLPGAALRIVLGIVTAEHRVAHRTDLQ
ncbi:Uncharacterised protein [Mycobacteroides abscessus subsp. abscessus]|nr:Uncharacterised protein [Mycobacteroides abscessus subsp. abscessus]